MLATAVNYQLKLLILYFLVNNPAIDLDIDELEMIARSIGTPVNAFLQQAEVASLIPEGVEIPSGEDDSGDRMSSQAMVSLMVTAAAMAVLVKA